MNTYAKGYRNEKRCLKELEDLGYRCWRAKITRFAKNDYFELFDIVAVKGNSPTLWIQVKSNKVSKKVRDNIKVFGEDYLSYNDVCVAVWIDRTGWKLYWPVVDDDAEEVKSLSESKLLGGI